ncbi:MAG TPA: choice-of-anchor L domain-containing protein, partial [Chitinophagales bacterium]|nr:choice-of-anchor L domain-containing protein [Chitinophagales bacterium]
MPIRKWAVWIILAAFVEIPHTLQAQLEVTTGYTATELANALAGTGVTISGATLVCANGASGMFDCVDCNVGLSDGVILTTGSAAGAVGPNNNTEISTNNGTAGDADLNALPGVSNTHDGCVLEFDITPVFDEISFEYVFGSDEYLEYVGPINDVFAFFISGPGIAGTVNIALVPGTSIPVGISTVNSTSYSAYYNNNGTGAGGVYSTDPYYIQYDGFTDVFTATQEVIPCETYHLKLAIGDEADHFVDSGVFLQANSLGGTDNIAFSYSGGPYCPTDPDPVPVPDPGATIGTFSSTPAGLVINTATGEIDIDASVPGTYTVTNTVVVPGYCDPLYYSVTITILEGPEVIIDPTDPVICTGESVELEAIATPSGGDCSPVTFSNLTDYAIPAGPTVSSPIAVSGISPLGFSTAMLESVCLNIDHTFDADLDISLQCPDGTTINLSSDNGGAGDDYTNTCFVVSGAPPVTSGSAPFTGSFTPEQPFSMLTGCTVNGTWNLVIDDDLAGDLGTLLDWSISFVCTNEIESYSWTPATGLSSTTDSLVDASPVTTTTYTVTVTETAGCATTATTTVTVTDAPTAGFVYSGSPYCTDEADPAPLLDAGASSGTWSSSPPGLVINAATGIVDLSLSAPGTYTITNAVTGPGACPDALETSTITISPSYAFTFTDEICSGDTYVLPDGSTTGSGGTYTANLITIDGCDSVITTILTEHTSTAVTEDVSLCDGTSYILPDGSSVGTAGTYISSLTSVFGCDSVITTNITIEPSLTTDLTEAICDGDTYTLPDGSTTTSSG